ncbi:MAG: hypothetical protein JO122_20645 [Acetobacteraceae bacterium]|nr:hypothetical protein [Acetobacteraceae bacterium]
MRNAADFVATVGRRDVLPGAAKVIPADVRFTIDMRGPADAVRLRASQQLTDTLTNIGNHRHNATQALCVSSQPRLSRLGSWSPRLPSDAATTASP